MFDFQFSIWDITHTSWFSLLLNEWNCLLYFTFSWAALLCYPEQVQMIQLWASLDYGKIVPYFGHSYVLPWVPTVGLLSLDTVKFLSDLVCLFLPSLESSFLNKRDCLAIHLWVSTAMPLQGDSAFLGSLFLLLSRNRMLL